MKRNEDPSVCFAFGVAECGGSHHLTTHLWTGQTRCKRRRAASCDDGVEDYLTDDPLTVPRSLVTVAPPACLFGEGTSVSKCVHAPVAWMGRLRR
jgi:hypothetical protein